MVLELTQRGKAKLESFVLEDPLDPEIYDSKCLDLAGFAEDFGLGLKELRIGGWWDIGGLSGLASLCPNLEELDISGRSFKRFSRDVDVFPDSLRKATIRGHGYSTMEALFGWLNIGGESERIVMLPDSSDYYCHQKFLSDVKVSSFLTC